MSSYVKTGRPLGRPIGRKDSYKRTRHPNSTENNDFSSSSPQSLPPASSLILSCHTRQMRQDKFSDDQIISKLNRESPNDPRIVACRKIFQLTDQWPWEWAQGFEPRKWNINIVRNLRDLLKGIRATLKSSLILKNFKRVKDVLRERACGRDPEHPQLRDEDMRYALGFFGIGTPTKAKVTREPSRPALVVSTAPGSVAHNPIDVDADGRDHVDEGIECDPPQSPLFTEDEEDFPKHDPDATSISKSSIETSPVLLRSPGVSRETSKSNKRVRSIGHEVPFEMHIYTVASIEPSPMEVPKPEVPFEVQICTSVSIDPSPIEVTEPESSDVVMTESEHQPQDLSELMLGLDILETKETEEKAKLAQCITELRTTLQAKETNLLNLTTEVKSEGLNKLYQVLKCHKDRKLGMQDGRAFFQKQTSQDPIIAQNTAATVERYNKRIEDCDESIKKTEQQIKTEKEKNFPLISDLKMELQRDKLQLEQFEDREQELSRNLEYYQSVKALTSLGSLGIEPLLTKFKCDNIPILKMVEEVKQRFNAV